ncbi:MAG: peptidylglycine alpha-amidating monooxygenase [Minicystis sp.]
MRPSTLPLFGLLSVIVNAACGSDDRARESILPCDVSDVLAKRCATCHGATPSFGAPMPLVTYADLLAAAPSDPARRVYEVIGTRTHDDARPMPQPPYPRLDATEQKTLDDWIAAGAPAATASCDGGSGHGGGGGPSCVPDVHVVPSTPYTVPTDTTDAYICYGIDVTASAKRHVTAFLPRIDNPKIVHHIVLFQADASAEPGPTPCALGGSAGWRIIGVWAPGNTGFTLPPEAGFPLEGTAHYVVQVHYNNVLHLSGESDASGFDFCTTSTLRPNDADVLAFGAINFSVPPQGSLDVTCEYQAPAVLGSGIRIVGGMPHMHKLGTRISTVRLGESGPEDLGTRDPWSFEDQFWSPIDRTVMPGDTIRTRCAWDNPGTVPVGFGENTEDEMCFTFAIYYPRIADPKWKWLKPAVGATCSPTP